MVQGRKEIQAAIRLLNSCMNTWDGRLQLDNVIPHSSLVSGFVAFSSTKFELQKGNDWRWNLTSRYRNVVLKGSMTADVQKMVTRPKTKGGQAPTSKVWLFNLKTNSRESLHFLWCEKGLEYWDSTPNIRLEDFAFLSQFVCFDLAKEFNWLGDTRKLSAV